MEKTERTICEIWSRCRDIKSERKREKDKRYYYKNREKILKKMSEYQKKKRANIALSDEELCKLGRDNLGRFKTTTGTQKYKVKQKNGKRKGVHVLVWEKYYNKNVPDGYVIHHKDENKFNNDIKNLELMKHGEHSRMHFEKHRKKHGVWNKGIATHHGNNEFGHPVHKKTIGKQKCTKFNKMLSSYINIWEMVDKGIILKDIPLKLNLTIGQVRSRWIQLNKIIDTDSGRLK